MISGSALAYATRQIASLGGGVNFGNMSDGAAMTASQNVPMTTNGATVSWVGPNTPSAPWVDNNGNVALNAIYAWRFRFWSFTAPGATGILFCPTGAPFGQGYVLFRMDDLVAMSGYRPGVWFVNSYGPNDNPAPPTIRFNWSATDPTGVMKYDMQVSRLAY